MSNQARRKEKQRLKRQKKRDEIRRANAVSPYKRIGIAGEVEACYINSDWRERGLASIYLLRRNPAGGFALSSFLIDVWCAGLKDAWGRLDLMIEEFKDYISRAGDAWGVQLVRIDPDEVRRLVAASIRFAQRNGFRLPPHYNRWTSMLGSLPPVTDEDLADFGKDGGLLWVGPMDDLRQRLIACTPEEFLRRENVHFISEADEFLDDDEKKEDEELTYEDCMAEFEESSAQLLERCKVHLAQSGQMPAARLADAARFILAQFWLGESEAPAQEMDDAEDLTETEREAYRDAANESLVQLIGTPQDTHISDDLKIALAQIAKALNEMDRKAKAQDAVHEALRADQETSLAPPFQS